MSNPITEYSNTEAALIVLRERYEGVSFMVDVPAGMKEAREARGEIRGYRVDLEKLRKDIKAPALEHCRAIDSEAKRITEELTALEQPIAEQIKAVEARKEAERQAEEDRVAAAAQKLEYPGDDALIAGIAEHFSVDADTAVRWVVVWAGLGQ